MLEAFRTHKRWLMFIAMILVIPSFVVTGIYSYNRMISDDGALAKVDGESITQEQFDNAKRQQLENLRVTMGQAFQADMLDTADARVAIMQSLLNERAVMGEVAQNHILVSDDVAVSVIKSLDSFQKDGRFNRELYENYLASTGYSDQYFVQLMKADISRNLMQNNVGRSVIVPKQTAEQVHRLLTEKRPGAMAKISLDAYKDGLTVTDEEIESYWKDNQSLFLVPDEVDVEYVVLTPDLFANVTPSEEDIQTFYEQNPNRFKGAEERRARHILITGADAKAKAEKLLEELRADRSKFEALAKANSADDVSAAAGGDLGFFTRGQMVPAFDEAVFAAKKGDLLDLVQTEFGWHIIEVTDINASKVIALEDARDEIIKLYREQVSQEQFATEAETFSNMVYEQSDSLAPVADKYKLKATTVKNVQRGKALAGEAGVYLNGNVVEALFSEESLVEKRNTQAIEVAPNTLVAARVTEYRASHTQSLNEAREMIRTTLLNQKALEKAEAAGRQMVVDLQQGKSLDLKFTDITYNRLRPVEPMNLLDAALRIPADQLPRYVGIKADDGYYIARVDKSEYTAPTEKDINSVVQNTIMPAYGNNDQRLFLAALRAVHKAEILNPNYAPGATDSSDVTE